MASIPSVNRLEITSDTILLDTKDKEIIVILLSGEFKVKQNYFYRKNVFDAEPQGFFVSNDGKHKIIVEKYAEFCIISNKSNLSAVALSPLSAAFIRDSIPLTVINSVNVVVKQAGEGNFSRKVKTIVQHDSGLKNLIVGETIKPPGNWSSWPPHKHDSYEPDKESQQKEIYLYKFEKEVGFGIQMIYTQDPMGAKVKVVKNNDMVNIEKGYHPVVASPYSSMYYLWVLFGNNSFFKPRYAT